MSTSLVCSSIPSETHNAPSHCRRPPKLMVACIENSRAEAPRNSPSFDSNHHQIDKLSCKYVEFSRPSFVDAVQSGTVAEECVWTNFDHKLDEEEEETWRMIREEAQLDADQEPLLQSYYFCQVLGHNSLASVLASHLANKLSFDNLPSLVLFDVFAAELSGDQEIRRAVIEDLKAANERDPACISLVHCLLNYKGFLACQAHRVAHKLWSKGRKVMALLIQNRVSEVFAVDIHPGARIGHGILFDHATGVVIGETAVIGNNVSILHNVTLGGTGKASGDRHPKIGNSVLIGAGTHVLGNVRIGEGAKVGAGSVVLKEVPARTTAVGNPARLVGGKDNPIKLDKLPSLTMDHTSFISDWSDYVI